MFPLLPYSLAPLFLYNKPMNILIIGGAGYIGSHVVREFLDRGHKVTVFDNLSSGLWENIPPEAEFHKGTIMDYGFLHSSCRLSFDAVVHLAAFKAVGESMEKPEKYSLNNICGTINILNAMADTGVKYMVFSSSASVYGTPQYVPLDEKHPINPESYYAFTKAEIERFMGWYDKLKGIHFASLRYFNAAGYDVKGRVSGLERNPSNLIPVIMEVAVGMRKELAIFGSDYETRDGTCIRDYVHVSDLAAGHAAALDFIVKNDSSLTINMGSETGASVLEILSEARRITGRPIPSVIVGRRAGDPAVSTASAKLARDVLGWKPEHSAIETILKSTWEVYSRSGIRV